MTLAQLEADLDAARRAFNEALEEIGRARDRARRAAGRYQTALERRVEDPTADVAEPETKMQTALEQLATVEAKYGLAPTGPG